MIAQAVRLFLPNRAGWIFLLLLALFLFGRSLLLLGDGDIARHIMTGQYFFQHGKLPTTNHICALAPDREWLTNSFLSDLGYAAAFQLAGLNGVVLIAAIFISWALVVSYQLGRERGAGPLISLTMLCLATAVTSLHWLARPHIITYVFFLAYYYLCFVSTLSPGKRTASIALLTLLWANVHGSFYFGIGMLGCKLLADLIRPNGARKSAFFSNLIVLLLSLAAATINTRGGASFLLYVFQFLSSRAAIFNTEHKSIDFAFGAPVWCFITICVLIAFIWSKARQRPALSELLFTVLMFCGSLYAMRLMPYFALMALPAIAPQWASLRQRYAGNRLMQMDERMEKFESNSLRTTAWFCAGAILMYNLWLLLPQFKLSDYDPQRMPVGATNYIKEHHIDGLGFTRDNWACYVHWKTGQSIFIDDYIDLYPPELIDDYLTIFFTRADWQKVLAKYKFNYVLIPPEMPLAQYLMTDPSWRHAYADQTSILFVRN